MTLYREATLKDKRYRMVRAVPVRKCIHDKYDKHEVVGFVDGEPGHIRWCGGAGLDDMKQEGNHD